MVVVVVVAPAELVVAVAEVADSAETEGVGNHPLPRSLSNRTRHMWQPATRGRMVAVENARDDDG